MWRKQYRFMVLLTLCFCLLFGVLQMELSFSASHRTVNNSIGMEFVLIPAGTFTMGSPPDEPQREPDERQYRVTVSKPFYFQTTEVTQAQWKKVMNGKPSHFTDTPYLNVYCPGLMRGLIQQVVIISSLLAIMKICLNLVLIVKHGKTRIA